MKIFNYSIPVALGYIPLGAAFGILFHETEYPIIFAIILSIIVYAASAQFLSITMLLNQVPILDVFLFILLLNSRHIFYALHTFKLYKEYPFFTRLYLMTSLTDETFSIISTLPQDMKDDKKNLVIISILHQCWWVSGTIIGSVLGEILNIQLPGLEFALVALFVVLLIEQFYQSNKIVSVLIACVSAIASFVIFGGENFLISSIGIALSIFVGYHGYARLVHR